MKKAAIFIWLFFISSNIYAYSWIPFCPDTIQANNICFNVGSLKGVICSEDGMYLWEDDIEEWSFFTYAGLPVNGAAYLDATRILVVMGNGSYSDGVYSFNLQTKQFEIVEWIFKPAFIEYYQEGGVYYIGSKEANLYVSLNGDEWSEVEYFNEIPCEYMCFYGSNLIVSQGSYDIPDIHISDDAGSTWTTSLNGGYFEEVEFDLNGMAFAVMPGISYSAGVYRSLDYGNYWEPLYWEFNISAVGCDALGNVFLGWDNGMGIAMLDEQLPYPEPVFLNEGLPSLNINNIKPNHFMSSIAIFCCTDQGVWMSNDYMVGEEDHLFEQIEFSLFPNPFDETLIVDLAKMGNNPVIVEIFSISGQKYFEKVAQYPKNSQQSFFWNPAKEGLDLSPGIYFVKLTQEGRTMVKKVIYSK